MYCSTHSTSFNQSVRINFIIFIHEGAMVLSVFPGSRLQEVRRMLSVFEKTMEVLHESLPELVTIVHVASNWHVEKYINKALQKWPVRAILVPGGCANLKYDALSVRERIRIERHISNE